MFMHINCPQIVIGYTTADTLLVMAVKPGLQLKIIKFLMFYITNILMQAMVHINAYLDNAQYCHTN